MKIAILSPFYPFRGGIAEVSENLNKEFRAMDIEVEALSFTTLYPAFLFPGKSQFLEKKRDKIFQTTRVLSSINPFTYKKTADLINQLNPNVIIIPYWISFLAPALGMVCKLLSKKIKIVALVHNALPHEQRSFDALFAKFFFTQCDAFISLSDYVSKDIKSLIPSAIIFNDEHPIAKKYVVRHTRNESCNKLTIESDKKNILFFGLIREYKGLDLLIEAMDYLDETYQLIIAGESYLDFTRYQILIDQSKNKDNIKVFEKYISDEDLPLFFTASDVLVLPYRSATQSGVLALAYEFDIPIVATNVGALGKAITDAHTGIVVDDISAKAIANGISNFFDSEDKEKYIDNIKTEKDRLSWAFFTKRLVAFLETKI